MGYQPIKAAGAEDRRKSTDMAVGDYFEGYVIGLPETNGDFGEQTNVLMQDAETEETFLVYTAGSLKYDARDGRIKLGLKTKITRLADEKRKSKAGKSYTTSCLLYTSPSPRDRG